MVARHGGGAAGWSWPRWMAATTPLVETALYGHARRRRWVDDFLIFFSEIIKKGAHPLDPPGPPLGPPVPIREDSIRGVQHELNQKLLILDRSNPDRPIRTHP
jgi:hypothetical protein